jgi:ribosomal protein S18 acetylase RimI-like enzyme
MHIKVIQEIETDLIDKIKEQSFKGYQYHYQHIDIEALKMFHLRNIIGKAGQGNLYGLYDSKQDDPCMLWGLVHNSFHSEVFEIPTFNVAPLFVFDTPTAPIDSTAILQGRSERALLECKVDVEDIRTLEYLQLSGFTLAGCTMKLSALNDAVDRRIIDAYTLKNQTSRVMRPAAAVDLPALEELIARTHKHSHYFNGSVPGREKGTDLFRQWIKRCFHSGQYDILVAERESEDVPAGFVSYYQTGALESVAGGRIGVIDFIAVHPDCQGKGLGQWLLASALDAMKRDCVFFEMRTALENYGAQYLYNKFGFRHVSSDYILHNVLNTPDL